MLLKWKNHLMIRAGLDDKNRIVDILADSFESNNSVNYIIPQNNRRTNRIRKLMAYSFDICLLYGDVFITEDKNACALILLPDKKKTTIRSVLLDVLLATTVIGLKNISRTLSRETSITKIHPNGLLYYIWFIGVVPSEQGKGFGSKLLNTVVEEGLNQKRTVCLETSTMKNVPWYEKHGFKTYTELDFGYKLYCMKKY